jgi:Tol biopolymer transport system component
MTTFLVRVGVSMLLVLATLVVAASATGRAAAVSATIVFERRVGADSDANVAVFTVRSDGSGLRRVTRGTPPAYGPIWTPDGHQIVYRRKLDAHRSALFLRRPDGRGERRVSPVSFAAAVDPSWSPDGRRLVYSDYMEDRFWITSLTGHATYVGPGAEAVWHPGRRDLIAYTRGCTIHLLTLPARRTSLDPPDRLPCDSDPAWAPNGTQIVFVRQRPIGPAGAVTRSLWTMRADGSQRRRITPWLDSTSASSETTKTLGGAVWSPNGRWLIWSQGPQYELDLWIARPNGTGRRRLTALPDAEAGPDWSPDSRYIVFTNPRGRTPFQHCRLYVIAAAGGTPRPLLRAPDVGCDSQPRWKP